MKRFDPGGIPEGADAITRLDPAQPPAAMARLCLAAVGLGAAYAAGSESAASDERKADPDHLRDSRSSRHIGRA
jgi:hypothetical protein